jgi:predicted nucleic acid-binding protein
MGQFLAGLAALPAERYSHTPLIRRIWELRHHFTAYDATYIALSEATDSVQVEELGAEPHPYL